MDKTSSCPETCLFPVKFKVMMTFAKILLGVDNRIKTEKKEREKKPTDKYQNCIKEKTKQVHQWDNFSETKNNKFEKKKIKNDNNKRKNKKDNKIQM